MSECGTREAVPRRFGELRWLPATVVVVAIFASTACAIAGESVAPPMPAARPVGAATTGALDQRVKLFTRALDLDAQQQRDLRQILEHQREAVRKVWNDRSLLPAERAPATRAVVGRTSDEIRGILNDVQLRKYNPPKPAPSSDTKPMDVSSWMDSTRKKPGASE